MLPLPWKPPRHEGYGAFMKNIAKSTRLATQDVKAVLCHASAFAHAEVKKNNKGRLVYIPPIGPQIDSMPKVLKTLELIREITAAELRARLASDGQQAEEEEGGGDGLESSLEVLNI